MTESPRGVLIFGGQNGDYPNKILELRADAYSWETLNKTLKKPFYQHVVIPIPWDNNFIKFQWSRHQKFLNYATIWAKDATILTPSTIFIAFLCNFF